MDLLLAAPALRPSAIDLTPVFVGVPGGPELLIILFLAVLLFGANKLPQLARSSGAAVGEFKRGRAELEDEIRDAATQRASGTDETSTTADADALVD